MRPLEKMLVGLAMIAGVLIVVAVGFGYWASTLDAVPMSAADLDKGGAYSAQERSALEAACRRSEGDAASSDYCGCLAQDAEVVLSRYERLMLTAGLESTPARAISIAMGLETAGLSEGRIAAADADLEAHVGALAARCREKLETFD